MKKVREPLPLPFPLYGIPKYRGMEIRPKNDDPNLPPLAQVFKTGSIPVFETRSLEMAFKWVDNFLGGAVEIERVVTNNF